METIMQEVLTAAAQLGAFWLVLRAELRSIWRARNEDKERIARLESKFIGG